MTQENQTTFEQQRPLFDWALFLTVHVVVIGAIGYAGFQVYGGYLGAWVFASAFVAGCAELFFFRYDVPGELLMKVALYLAIAANAAYLIHNGAKAAGVEAFNVAQIKKFEAGVAAASKTTSRTVARQIGLSAANASKLERVFADSSAVIAGTLGGIELALALIFIGVGMSLAAKQRRIETAGK